MPANLPCLHGLGCMQVQDAHADTAPAEPTEYMKNRPRRQSPCSCLSCSTAARTSRATVHVALVYNCSLVHCTLVLPLQSAYSSAQSAGTTPLTSWHAGCMCMSTCRDALCAFVRQDATVHCCREGANQRAQLGHTTESLTLIPCQQFSGAIASGAPLAQPFHMDVSNKVRLNSSPTSSYTWLLLAMIVVAGQTHCFLHPLDADLHACT